MHDKIEANAHKSVPIKNNFPWEMKTKNSSR